MRAPNRVCKSSACLRVAMPNGYCAQHAALATTRNDPPRSAAALEARKLYSTKAWRDLRRAFLSEHPLCCKCRALATDCDHITDHAGNLELFTQWENLQALCRACHSTKTAGTRGWGRRSQKVKHTAASEAARHAARKWND